VTTPPPSSGLALGDVLAGKTRANMGYETRKVTFLSLGFTATLAFDSTVSGAYGPVIDDVKVCSCGLL
jgi:hypothetical protein